MFLVFQKESHVEKLLMQCYTDDDRHYLLLSSPTVRDKPVGVFWWLHLGLSSNIMNISGPGPPVDSL